MRSSPQPPADTLLVDALVQTSFLTMATLNRIAADHDLSLTQLRVLAILRDRRLRMAELAAYLGLDKSTMTGLVARAEKRGLLARAANHSDGRAIDVTITPAGQRLAAKLYDEVARVLATRTGTLGPSDRRRLHTLLRQVLDSDDGR